MFMSSIVIASIVMMVVDWYIWEPRYRGQNAGSAQRQVSEASYRIPMRSAA